MLPWNVIRAALRRGRLGHAYLFTGAAGNGQWQVALRLAQALHCRAAAGGEPCGACDACRAVAERRHPALVVIAPQGGSIGIQRVREELRRLALAPRPGEHRVVIVEQAERLTADAANRLLKVLEEPPEQVTFVLLAEAAERLPETVVSRCRVVPFRGLPEAELTAALVAEGADPGRARVLARLAAGDGGRARDWHGRQVLDGLRRQALEGLLRLAGGDPLDALGVADEWARVERPEELLDLVDALCRDATVLRLGQGEGLLWNLDLSDALAELAALLVPGFELEQALKVTAAARRALEAHAPKQLVMEVACARLQDVMAG